MHGEFSVRCAAPALPPPESAGGPENAGGEGNPLLRLLHAVGGADRDAPMVVAAGRPSPFLGTAELVVLADPLHLGGVFDHDFIRADEIGEDVIARPMPPDAPFDGEAAVAQAPGAIPTRATGRIGRSPSPMSCSIRPTSMRSRNSMPAISASASSTRPG